MMRTCTLWNEHWKFIKEDTGPARAVQVRGKSVTLPHTWNAADGQDGGNDYYRGTCWYVKRFPRPELEAGGEAWLEFRGAAMTAEVWLNGEKLARHEGGYSTFRVNLTGALREDNVLAVSVDNGKNRAVYPQKADFTFYGGIYRDVYLLTVPAVHFALDRHGAPALKVTPSVTENGVAAKVAVETLVAGDADHVTFALNGQEKRAPSWTAPRRRCSRWRASACGTAWRTRTCIPLPPRFPAAIPPPPGSGAAALRWTRKRGSSSMAGPCACAARPGTRTGRGWGTP